MNSKQQTAIAAETLRVGYHASRRQRSQPQQLPELSDRLQPSAMHSCTGSN